MMMRFGRNLRMPWTETDFHRGSCLMLRILLDTGLLEEVTHPRCNPDIANWLKGMLQSGAEVLVPEIADYELRRKLLHIGSAKSIRRLDDLKSTGYVPITTETMLKAAEFWADARRQGRQTAQDESLDGDMILSAQAACLAEDGDEVIIATENVGHLALFADAREWEKI